MNSLLFAVFAVALATVSAKPVGWSTSHDEINRRLALETQNSHVDAGDDACIVGATDTEDTSIVYVGGPCSEIVNGEPQAGFRYVGMRTFYARIVPTGSNAELPLDWWDGHAGMRARTNTDPTYAEANLGLPAYHSGGASNHAGVYLSVNSYLAQSDFTFTRNSFLLDRDGTELEDVCAVPCCTGILPAEGCQCSGGACSDIPTSVSVGDYKYSIFAASFDLNDNTYSAGPSGNGWERLIADRGVSGTFQGALHIYQGFDFTQLNASTLTVTSDDGSTETTYANMQMCDIMNNNPPNCETMYTVSRINVESDNWEGEWTFPTWWNRGEYSDSGRLLTVLDTKTMTVYASKITDANKRELGMDANAMVLVYQFDITGASATATSGNYMIYDPKAKSSGGSRRRPLSKAPSADLSAVTAMMALAALGV